MEIDPAPPTSDPVIPLGPVPNPPVEPSITSIVPQATSQASSSRKASGARAPVPTRTLRTRPSDPISYAPPPKVVHSSTPTVRDPNQHELEAIKRKLGEEGIKERREELVKEKEVVLKQAVEGHDAAVREKFHLERFISLLEGYDPELIKSDNSPVFLEYVKNHHNLLDLLPDQPVSSIAGPSRRPRSSIPARQTRRQAHEQSEILAHVVNTPAESSAKKTESAKGKIKVEHSDTPTDVKGKGKAKLLHDSSASPTTPKLKLHLKRLDGDIGGTKGKNRALMEQDMEPSPVPTKGKRTRGSLLAEHPAAKRLRDESTPATPSQDTSTPTTPRPPSEPPEPTREPTPLPSLAHLPFPPAPFRPKERLSGPREPWYTMVMQQPLAPKYGGDIASIIETYQDPSTPPLKTLELQAARDGYLKNRVTYLQNHGRLGRLLDESGRQTKAHRGPALPLRSTDFHDSLLAHMVQVRNAILNEAKQKPVVAKRIARMIQAYWEHIEGREERERAAEERDQKKRMKDLTRALRKRWNLAVKIVRARIQAAQKLEQDRLGKEHLQNMLQRSTGLLEAQRDDIAGERSDDEEEDSEGTDEVSSAEDDDWDDDSETTGGRPHNWRTGDYDPNNGFSEDDEGTDAAEDEGSQSEEDDQEENDSSNPDLRALIADDEDEMMDVDEADPITVEDLPEPLSAAEQEVVVDPSPSQNLPPPNDPPEPLSDVVNQSASIPPRDLEMAADGVIEATAPPEEGGVDPQPVLDAPAPLLPAESLGPNVIRDSISPPRLNGPHVSDLDDPSNPLLNGHDAQIATHSPVVLDAKVSSHENTATQQQPEVPSVEIPLVYNLEPPIGDSTMPPAPLVESGETLQPEIAPELALLSAPVSTEPPRTSPEPPELVAPQTLSISTTDELITPEPNVLSSRSRRARKSYSHADLVKTEDPDINDTEFVGGTSEIDEQDEMFDVEMEDEDEEEDDEDAGLLADADVPIEELLKRYGYGDVAAEADKEPSIENPEGVSNGVSADGAITDQSLLDENLPGDSTLIIEGKRQRRVRSVWTPEDNPQHMPKRPKVEEIESDYEMTPSVSESEEEEADEVVDQDPNRVGPPFLLRGTLRPYQQAGLEWLASLYQNSMNGILADEMGLGKTIQTIALLGHLACDKGIWGQHLIIVPTSVILNWEMEFKKFLPGLKILTYYGNQKERKDKRVGWNTENAWQVCITSYQIVLADQHIFRRKSWVYMILDEAHNIKNFRSQRWQTLLGFKAQRRLLLTGTPLQNNLMELWSLLYFLMPNGVTADATAVVGFANHKEFTEWFSNPMDKAVESGETLDQDTIETVAKLHTLLRPFILRRLKSEVETQLPGKFEHVVHCKLSKRQRFLYDEFMSRSSTKEALSSGGYLGVVNTLMQLRKVCNHPDLFEVRPVKTSFAMDPVLADYEPTEVLVRRRLLDQLDKVDFQVTAYETASAWAMASRHRLDASDLLPKIAPRKAKPPAMDTRTVEGWLKYREYWEEQQRADRWHTLRDINRRRCDTRPIYGSTLTHMLSDLQQPFIPGEMARSRRDHIDDFVPPAATLVQSYESRARRVGPLVDLFALIPPIAVARDMTTYALPGLTPSSDPALLDPSFDTLHQASVKLQIAFPDVSLLQYDCGKLQKLDEMLRDLKAGGHRVLIFTQMTRVLDILETFLSYNGHRYLRLDGSTKIEDRQIITERFNSDSRIFCFIASSRSGGVGINLTGADTVFFYDSDWNPSMDRQCMDRAHRIGQTREVHIYRFVSSHTVEENMLKKANQKRLLDRVVIQEGEFTTEFFGKMDWRDVLDAEVGGTEEDERMEDVPVEDEPEAVDAEATAPRSGQERELAKALAEVEDEEDAEAAKIAQGEGELDIVEFEEQAAKKAPVPVRSVSIVEPRGSSTPMASAPPDDMEDEDEDDVGAVDEYMLRSVEWDWEWFSQF